MTALRTIVNEQEHTQRLPLNHARAQLGLTQEQLAELADVHINAIRRCEQKRGHISLINAYAILRALNRKRAEPEFNMPELLLDDLSWEIQE